MEKTYYYIEKNNGVIDYIFSLTNWTNIDYYERDGVSDCYADVFAIYVRSSGDSIKVGDYTEQELNSEKIKSSREVIGVIFK